MSDVDEIDTDHAEQCGCDFLVYEEIDGRRVEIHHVWPDDGAPHSETSECGCGPQRLEISPTMVVYDHNDQDPQDLF